MKKHVVPLLILVVLLAAWWWYYAPSNIPPDVANIGRGATTTPLAATSSLPSTAPSSPARTSAKAPAPQSGKKSPTYTSIITQSGSHACDYEQVGAAGRTSGVVYIADGKMRAEMRTSGTEINARTLMIYDGRYLYTWTEGTTAGVKTQPSSLSQLPLVIPRDLSQSVVLGSGADSVSWHCRSWLKDPKLLVPPSYVTFTSRL